MVGVLSTAAVPRRRHRRGLIVARNQGERGTNSALVKGAGETVMSFMPHVMKLTTPIVSPTS